MPTTNRLGHDNIFAGGMYKSLPQRGVNMPVACWLVARSVTEGKNTVRRGKSKSAKRFYKVLDKKFPCLPAVLIWQFLNMTTTAPTFNYRSTSANIVLSQISLRFGRTSSVFHCSMIINLLAHIAISKVFSVRSEKYRPLRSPSKSPYLKEQ